MAIFQRLPPKPSLVFVVVSLSVVRKSQAPRPAIDRCGTLSAGRQATWPQTVQRLVRQPGPVTLCGS